MTNNARVRNKKHVVVVGAGAAGLFAALTLARQNCQVDLIDQLTNLDQKRKQRQHPHLLLSEGSEILRFMFEHVWQELLRSSSRLIRISDLLQNAFPEYIPTEGDMKSHFLTFSRIELENILWEEVKRNPKINVHDANVEGFTTDTNKNISGIKFNNRTLNSNLVVDASGRLSQTSEMLTLCDLPKPEELIAGGTYVSISRLYKSSAPCPYFQLLAEKNYRGGIYPLKNNLFHVAFHLPQNSKLVPELINSSGFNAFASSIEKLAPFMDDAHALGSLNVLGGHKNSLKKYSPIGGYLPIGDRLCQTNPIYGHGITYILKQMQILTSALLAYSDMPEDSSQWLNAERKTFASVDMSNYFLTNCYRELDAYWNMIAMADGHDSNSQNRFATLRQNFFQNKVLPVVRGNPDHFRDFLRVFLLEKSPYQMILNPKLHFDIFKAEVKNYLAKN